MKTARSTSRIATTTTTRREASSSAFIRKTCSGLATASDTRLRPRRARSGTWSGRNLLAVTAAIEERNRWIVAPPALVPTLSPSGRLCLRAGRGRLLVRLQLVAKHKDVGRCFDSQTHLISRDADDCQDYR